MRKSLTLFLAAICLAVGFCSVSTADIILVSDDFNRTAGNPAAGSSGGLSDWGMNNNALGGTTNQTYKVRTTAAGTSTEQQFVDGNLGRLRLGHGVVDFDLLSNSTVLQNGFQASFDFQRGGGGYIAFAIGMTPAEIEAHPQNNARIGVPFATNIPETDFGFLFRPPTGGQGQTEIWRGGVQTTGPLGIFNATSITGSPTSLLNQAVVRFTPAVAGQWGAGSTINAELVVNNGTPLSYSFLSDGSGLGYFGFHSNAGASVAQAGVDNLVISAIPEPSSLSLVAVLALGLGLRRRR
jgi:hypothetical protein